MAEKKKVKMRFTENKFYNDLTNPLYFAGKIYEIEDDMVARWIKRGGEIVDDDGKPVDEPDPTSVVEKPVEVSGEGTKVEEPPTGEEPVDPELAEEMVHDLEALQEAESLDEESVETDDEKDEDTHKKKQHHKTGHHKKKK